jgi:hypothetical protein
VLIEAGLIFIGGVRAGQKITYEEVKNLTGIDIEKVKEKDKYEQEKVGIFKELEKLDLKVIEGKGLSD